MARKKQQNSCLPLELVNRHKEIWSRLQMDPNDDVEIWMTFIKMYMERISPTGQTTSTYTELISQVARLPAMVRAKILQDISFIFSLAKWRSSKEIYRIDRTLFDELSDTAENTSIPAEIVEHMPYDCVYIQIPEWNTDIGKEIDGVLIVRPDFAKLGDDDSLLFTWLYDDEYLTAQIKKKDGVYRNNSETHLRLQDETLSVLQYLCAVNADILPAPSQKTVYRRDSVVKDKYHEIRQWDVGIRVGSALHAAGSQRKGNSEPLTARAGSGSAKRPHIRRAHWHHYWIGPRNGPAGRELTVKWITPTGVNIRTGSDLPAVTHHVDD